MVRWIAIVGLIALLPILSVAEESESETGEVWRRQKLTVSVGYTYVPKGAENKEDDEGVFVPTAGIDYFYSVSRKWEIGLMFDVEFKEYVIPDKDLHRHNSIALAVVAGYELLPSWSVLAGGGVEIEETENLPLVRVGTEYEFRPGGSWIIAPGLIFDIKEEYTSIEIVLGAGMEF